LQRTWWGWLFTSVTAPPVARHWPMKRWPPAGRCPAQAPRDKGADLLQEFDNVAADEEAPVES
jgi:hypothetical protein